MIEAWDDRKLKKLSINSLIGSMVCRSEPKCYTIRSTNFPYDVPEGGIKMENDVCIDYIYENTLRSNDTLLPIWEQIVETEHLRCAQLLHAAQRIDRYCIRQCRTDCWIIQTGQRRQKKMIDMFQNMTFDGLGKIIPQSPFSKKLYKPIPQSEERCCRVEFEDKALLLDYKIPEKNR